MKVLVVEDEPLIRLGLASIVEDAGYDAAEARTAGEAIGVLDKDGAIGLMVTDVDMPGGMDGVGLAHYVRRRWPQVQLIVISGKRRLELRELPAGARFVGKPYEEHQLIGLVRVMMGDRVD